MTYMLKEMKKWFLSVLRQGRRARSAVGNEISTYITTCIVEIRLTD
jgi:hypothetical protein